MAIPRPYSAYQSKKDKKVINKYAHHGIFKNKSLKIHTILGGTRNELYLLRRFA